MKNYILFLMLGILLISPAYFSARSQILSSGKYSIQDTMLKIVHPGNKYCISLPKLFINNQEVDPSSLLGLNPSHIGNVKISKNENEKDIIIDSVFISLKDIAEVESLSDYLRNKELVGSPTLIKFFPRRARAIFNNKPQLSNNELEIHSLREKPIILLSILISKNYVNNIEILKDNNLNVIFREQDYITDGYSSIKNRYGGDLAELYLYYNRRNANMKICSISRHELFHYASK